MRNFFKKLIIICLLAVLAIPGVVYLNGSDEPGPIGLSTSKSVSH